MTVPVVADGLSRFDLSAQLMDAGSVIGREVNIDLYESDQLEEAARSPSTDLSSVREGEKRWVIRERDEPAGARIDPSPNRAASSGGPAV